MGPGLPQSFRMTREWVDTVCGQCGAAEVRPVLLVPHADAPGGRSHVVACAACGLRRLHPRPGPSSIGAYYDDASGYNAFVGRKRGARAQQVWDFFRDGFSRPVGISGPRRWLSPITRPLARWLFDINVPIEGRSGLRVIEVGSGFGDVLIYLGARGCKVLGTDLSKAASVKAREYGVEVRIGNLVELALPESSFDVAILCHSLEHVPDPDVELRELSRLLAPGGRIHIAVPNGEAVRLTLDGVEWAHLSHPLHFWYFDALNLTRLLERHGFRVVGRPWTTTRHHALMGWLHEGRHGGWGRATRRFLGFLRATAGNPLGGDVLRVVAEKVGPVGSGARERTHPSNSR